MTPNEGSDTARSHTAYYPWRQSGLSYPRTVRVAKWLVERLQSA